MAKILIVEDDHPALEALRSALSGAGHTCTCLMSGKDVLESARNERPDLLLLDVMLPGLSGFELCRQFRRDPDLYMMPILIVSAMSNEEEVSHGLAQGADDYIAKPYDPRNLLHRVDLLLRTHGTSKGPDEVTQLPGTDATKREIQRRLSQGQAFALMCAELEGLREYGRSNGGEGRNRAIRHLGRALHACGQRIEDNSFFVGHMGGGYFICLLRPDRVQTYCAMSTKVWQSHVEKLRAESIPRHDNGEGRELLGLLVCVTVHDAKGGATAQQMFETLAQLRQKALGQRQSGVYVDRRATGL